MEEELFSRFNRGWQVASFVRGGGGRRARSSSPPPPPPLPLLILPHIPTSISLQRRAVFDLFPRFSLFLCLFLTCLSVSSSFSDDLFMLN